MVTNPQETPETTQKEQIESATRSLIAGHPQGAVRRIILWSVAFGLIVLGFPMAAILPMLLLALTDQLV